MPDEVSAAPAAAVGRLSQRLGIAMGELRAYGEREQTRTDHLDHATALRSRGHRDVGGAIGDDPPVTSAGSGMDHHIRTEPAHQRTNRGSVSDVQLLVSNLTGGAQVGADDRPPAAAARSATRDPR
ncbi:hypothetical protein GCM10022225_37240 [Plantactinospora mayteni]|uniref:DUF4158 domain-containing protein n=1 Tax=Plantactinospora mayteni TaxID=566021 RepID=A0ABQ4EKM4_9ACTN|nr:hypothetical protein Pma05_18770 [Plantactinospora mayteni]